MVARKRMSNTIVATTALALIAGAAYWIYAKSRDNTIMVTNAGLKSIQTFVVTVCGADYLFQDIPGGGQSQQVFVVTGDSGFLTRGEFDDGGAIKGGFGYVTRSVSPQHVEIVVHDDGSVTGKQ